jgi:hypothetical protein
MSGTPAVSLAANRPMLQAYPGPDVHFSIRALDLTCPEFVV